MPPPNVTGQLHMGHALDATLQDVLTRYKRMQGFSALWLPGYDHAGIATQIKVEEHLRNTEHLTRYDLGRDKFLDRVWDWKNKYGDRIVAQQKTLGASCDWSRSRFTMDDGCSKAVRETFCELYEKGLIYKGNRIINWCPHCRTALSDAEVEYKDMPGHFWHIRYPIEDSDEEFIIATTRPETMLGDSGVAVHPDDERYQHLVGKNAILPLVGRRLPIVADDYVELGFGTGAVKMTPCHDPNDYEVGLRHNLEQILIMNEDAHIINGGKYNGMDRDECREAIVADLEAEGFLVKVEDYNHNVGCCYRCGNPVEPMTSPQWFVKMKPLAQPAIDCVRDGRIQFVPDRFSKTYYNWMENVHDWCISRQLWWGHQIPAWYCDDCGHITVSRTDACECEACHSKNIHQDEDVLDTWFSSALWPFSTLGWPDKNEELDYWYPTTVMVTGYDIIFFWVARMIFSGMEQMKEIPFHKVFIHGLVRDDKGRKMSKSLGNGIDPLEMAETYGADALRFNLVTGNSPGNDMRFYVEKCGAMRNFANKLWNASRFVMMNLTIDKNELPEKLELEDKWILSKLNTLSKEVCDNLDKYELGIAAAKIYDFIWDTYCDWYIELTKPRLNSGDEAANKSAQQVLLYVLTEILKLLHPFMPFITEEIWQALPHDGEALMIASYPKFDPALAFPAEEQDFESVMAAIRAVRSRRSEMNVPPSRKAQLIIVSEKPEAFRSGEMYICKLAYADRITLAESAPDAAEKMVSVVTNDAKIFMPLAELVDLDAERARLTKELEKARKQVEGQERKLANENFVSRAPEQVVATERERLEKAKALVENLTESLKNLG
ncbi:MAG: valine--tRNA ligase, partial [Oscillospiraceae bacterium]|nr:valine--tRNA ligase [Oscillospiraceae bacterium]